MSDSQTKTKLLTAARQLFTEKGFAGASTREIVELAGVTKPTLYYHFSSKEELYRVLIEENFTRFNQALEEIASARQATAEKLIRIAAYNLEHCQRHPQDVKLSLMAIYRGDTFAPEVDILSLARTSIDIITRVFREGMDAGDFLTTDPMKPSMFLLSILHGQMLVILNAEKGMTIARPEEIIEFVLRGVASR